MTCNRLSAAMNLEWIPHQCRPMLSWSTSTMTPSSSQLPIKATANNFPMIQKIIHGFNFIIPIVLLIIGVYTKLSHARLTTTGCDSYTVMRFQKFKFWHHRVLLWLLHTNKQTLENKKCDNSFFLLFWDSGFIIMVWIRLKQNSLLWWKDWKMRCDKIE